MWNSPAPVAACAQAFAGPAHVCTALPQLQLFLYILDTFVYKLNVKQFCDLKVNGPYLEYDFVVVGGGTTGAVVAARLSEIRSWNVLLIEAGPEEPLGAMVPSMMGYYLGSELDWNYTTTGEKTACLSQGGRCPWPRGKNLGGCSVHNGMMYMRGHPEDYDRWNIPDWSYEDVLPFFKKAESNEGIRDKYHGTEGPLPVAPFPWQPAVTADILGAAEELGLGLSRDLNGEQITGFTVAQTMNSGGVRASTASAYLRPAHGRPNLQVLLNAQATKVRVENYRGIKYASGVEFVKDGVPHFVKARGEVVVSGGAVGSPHLLLLSGIGPREHLQSKGVEVVHDLPGVGENLQNHVSFSLGFSVNETANDIFLGASLQYMFNQTGPMSSTGLSQITGIVASKYASAKHPDLQFFFGGYTTTCDPASNSRQFVGINPTYLHPKSRGSLRLNTSSPFDHPVITQNYLSEKSDLDGLVEAVMIGLRMANTTALKKRDIRLEMETVPQCAQLSDEAYWRCAVMYNTGPENHQAGTCKMGSASDAQAVVDPELRVHGIQRLRVADASVIPALMSGNTVAPVVMIGERVAEFIKEDYVPYYDSPYCRRRRRGWGHHHHHHH